MDAQIIAHTPAGAVTLAALWYLAFVRNERALHDAAAVAGPTHEPQDTRAAIGLAIAGAYAVAVMASALGVWVIEPAPDAFVIGCMLLVVGAALRRASYRALGEAFTLEVREVGALACGGPYEWLMHPGYAAGLILLAGVGLVLGSWFSLAVLLVVASCVYGRRIAFEEACLHRSFGAEFERYRSERWRLIPFVW